MHEAAVEVAHAALGVVVSLDGVMAQVGGGYRQASCGRMSSFDADGERLHSVRMGRVPESNNAPLNSMVSLEVEAVLAKRLALTVVKLVDGPKYNWALLTGP